MKSFKLAAAAAAFVAVTQAHICLVSPAQRGGFNISDAGDNSCYRPQAPCGSIVSGAPSATLLGGQGWPVFFQQNLNHYNPGFPGYLDVSLAFTSNPSSQDNFTLLARIPDFWAHLQAQQTNVSMPVLVPNVDCPACTLQVRYVPHKQTEPIFHNCADVVIVQQPAPAASGAVFGFGVSGNAAAPFYSAAGSDLMSILPSGEVLPLPSASTTALPTPVAVPEGAVASLGADTLLALARPLPAIGGNGPSADDGMASVLITLNTAAPGAGWAALPLGSGPDYPIQWDGITTAPAWAAAAAAAGMSKEGKEEGAVEQRRSVRGRAAAATTASSAAPSPTTAFLIGRDAYPNGTFRFQVRIVDTTTGSVSPILAVSAPDGGNNPDPMVNFMAVTQAYVDPASPTVATFYILSGDENSLFGLNAAVYTVTVDLRTPNPSPVVMRQALLDVSAWTINSLTLDPASGKLYSLSPGLYGSTNGYWLVTVDPATGAVAPVGTTPILTPASLLSMDPSVAYKGRVYGAAVRGDGCLLHLVRRALGGAPMLACVDLGSGQVKDAPSLLTGANNVMEVASLVRLA